MSGQIFEPGTFRIQASGLFTDPTSAYTQASSLRPLAELPSLSDGGSVKFQKILDLDVFFPRPRIPKTFSPWVVTYSLR